MAIFPTPISAVTTVFLLLTLLSATATYHPSDTLLSDLTDLKSQSSTGVIRLNDDLLRRIISSPAPRPFHFLLFFDAQHLHSKAELALPTLKSEFSLVASSFYRNNPKALNSPSTSLFFFDVEFQESQSTFAHFGVNSLPHIRLIPPSAKDMKSESIQMEQSDFSRLAESMAEFVESRAEISVGPIARPPLLSKTQIGVIAVLILISIPFLIKKLLYGKTIFHEKSLWMAGSIFIYFFSVSGAMFNIIRKMPMFITDRQDPSKLVFFYQGSGMQLGAEGFSVGFLYTIVGLLLAFATHVLVRVRNKTAQRIIMVFMLFVSFWAVKKVVQLDNWKTGYGIHAYWSSRW